MTTAIESAANTVKEYLPKSLKSDDWRQAVAPVAVGSAVVIVTAVVAYKYDVHPVAIFALSFGAGVLTTLGAGFATDYAVSYARTSAPSPTQAAAPTPEPTPATETTTNASN